MKTFKSTLMLIVLLLLCHQLNGQGVSESAACTEMQTEVFNVDASKVTASNKWCIPTYSFTFDCLMFNKIDGTCKTCPEGSTSVTYSSIFAILEKACIPLSQQAVGCTTYGRYGPNKYGCAKCTMLTDKVVPIVGNADKKGLACIPSQVPNCQEYIQFVSPIVGCNKCKSGFSQYTGGFDFQSGTSNGKACPKDGSVKQCTELTLNSGEYVCSSSGCPGGKNPLAFMEGETLVTCITLPSGPPAFDPLCAIFKNFQTDLTKLQCVKCQFSYQLISKVQSGVDTFASTCILSYNNQAGCTNYVTESVGSILLCKACDSRHNFLPLDSKTYSVSWDKSLVLGQCFLKDRWIIDLTQKSCTVYSMFMAGSVQPQCQTCAISGYNSPCQEPKGTCTNGQRQVSILGFGSIMKICAGYSTIIDHCALFFGSLSPTTCTKCDEGYELVNSLSNPLMPTFFKICIKKSLVIPSCYIYDNQELTCFQCNYGVDCTKPPQTPPSPFICAKLITVGYAQVCISCPLGYTLKNNTCYKSVERCANLAGDNYCLACVKPEKYQLVENRKCVEIPAFCKSVRIDGICDVCKDGYELDANRNCAPSNRNPCPQEQYLSSQNQCVPGSIKNCLIYAKDGLACNQCKQKSNLSSDFKKCEPTDKWADFPPCPANNTEFKYERKKNGDCLAIDSQCVGYNEENGYCFECGNNEYAYQGLCYKVNFGI